MGDLAACHDGSLVLVGADAAAMRVIAEAVLSECARISATSALVGWAEHREAHHDCGLLAKP
jgi:hypothetical protein